MGNRTKFRGGSLPIFAVVGAVLAIVLIGGLYALQRYSSQLEKAGEAVATETGNLIAGDDKKDTTTKNNDKTSTDSKTTDKKSSTDKPDTTVKRDSDAKPETEVAKPTPKTPAAYSEEASDQTLPETGPAGTALQVVALSFVTFAGVSYVRSRRAL